MKDVRIDIKYYDTIQCEVMDKLIYAQTVEAAIEQLKEDNKDNVIILKAGYADYEFANFVLTAFTTNL